MKVSKRVKMIGILILIGITLIILGSIVDASSFKFDAYATKTKVKPGEEIQVVMKIADIIDVNDLGINAVEATLEYDKDFFEVITPTELEGKNNWTITYNMQEGNFLVNNMISGIKSEQEIGQIKFQVKENVKNTKTKIYLKQIKSNDGTHLMYEEDKEIEIIIDEDKEVAEKEESNTNFQNTLNIQNTTASGSIPQTGEENIFFIAVAIVSIGIVSYVRYRKLQIK